MEELRTGFSLPLVDRARPTTYALARRGVNTEPLGPPRVARPRRPHGFLGIGAGERYEHSRAGRHTGRRQSADRGYEDRGPHYPRR
ncbi:hypothetical protein DXZ75_09800 [Streptomyces sp. AcE210]|nr:hypothetical protein DXZ75_09800 [Streptomyces sp. AcE210]